jgi:hypothetical protein
MVVHDLNVESIRFNPTEANPPLIVQPDAVLPQAVAGEGLQTIPWDRSKIENHRRRMKLVQLSLSDTRDTLKSAAELAPKDLLGIVVPERPDHNTRILPSLV